MLLPLEPLFTGMQELILQEYRAENRLEALQNGRTSGFSATKRKNHTGRCQGAGSWRYCIFRRRRTSAADIRPWSQSVASYWGQPYRRPSVGKEPGCIDHHQSLGDLGNMLFMGTVISRGHGLGLCCEYRYGNRVRKIAHMVQNEHAGPSPLQLQLSHLSRWIAIFVLCLAGLLFVSAIISGRDLWNVLTQHQPCRKRDSRRSSNNHFNLGFRVQTMAKIRPLLGVYAAETLGGTTVICTDKTGTLTQNQMTVKALYVGDRSIEVRWTRLWTWGDLWKWESLTHFFRLDELFEGAVLL